MDLLTARGIGVVILAKNGESRLQFDAHLEVFADATWKINRKR
jgi:hypothetical protein